MFSLFVTLVKYNIQNTYTKFKRNFYAAIFFEKTKQNGEKTENEEDYMLFVIFLIHFDGFNPKMNSQSSFFFTPCIQSIMQYAVLLFGLDFINVIVIWI